MTPIVFPNQTLVTKLCFFFKNLAPEGSHLQKTSQLLISFWTCNRFSILFWVCVYNLLNEIKFLR